MVRLASLSLAHLLGRCASLTGSAKLFAQLFIVARRAKIVPHSFDPVCDTKPLKDESTGYHPWTEDELAAFEAQFPIGTKSCLAFALLLYGAQRSGDVRFMTTETIADGCIRLAQSKTGDAIDVPIVEPLQEAISAARCKYQRCSKPKMAIRSRRKATG